MGVPTVGCGAGCWAALTSAIETAQVLLFKMSNWNDLTSPRLRLCCLLLEDAQAICAYHALPEVARYQSWGAWRREFLFALLRREWEARQREQGRF